MWEKEGRGGRWERRLKKGNVRRGQNKEGVSERKYETLYWVFLWNKSEEREEYGKRERERGKMERELFLLLMHLKTSKFTILEH